MAVRRLRIGLLLLAACGEGPAPAPPPEPVNDCAGPRTPRTCVGAACEESACRVDELCADGACLPWAQAPLRADFELTVDPEDSRTVRCRVAEGGFPREMVRSLRFDFGDGVTGWGEDVSHRYEAGGVYPVDLEVRLEGLVVLRAGRTAVVRDRGFPPASRLVLTVNRIPELLNGSVPFTSDSDTPDDEGDDVTEEFHLLAPTHGFTVDVAVLDAPNGEIDPESLSLTADVALGGGAVQAGAELIGRLALPAPEAGRVLRGAWVVGEDEAFPPGPVSLTLRATDAYGDEHRHRLSFETTDLTPETDPFDRPMRWLFRFDMDRFTTTADGGSLLALSHEPGPDGEADFTRELALVGMQGDESAQGAADVVRHGRTGANAAYRGWVVNRIVEETYRYFDIAPDGTPQGGVALTIVPDDDPTAPAPSDFREDGDFSMMRFGGKLTENLGRSRFSPWNDRRVDDTWDDLGIATGTIVGTLVGTPVASAEFDPVRPGEGVPVGEHPLDATVISDTFDRWDPDNDPAANARWDRLDRVAGIVALTVAAVTAHEMGHAMGLVPNGPPPAGFFGGRPDVTFMGRARTNSHHADYPGTNLMQAGGNILEVFTEALGHMEYPRDLPLADLALLVALDNRLSAYARAYLNRQLTYRAFQ